MLLKNIKMQKLEDDKIQKLWSGSYSLMVTPNVYFFLLISEQKYEAVVYFVFTDFVKAEAEKNASVTFCLPQIIVTPWLQTILVLKFEYPFLPFVSKNLLHKLQTLKKPVCPNTWVYGSKEKK